MESTKNHKEFWQQKWREHHTPWDLGGAHPLLAPIFKHCVLPKTSRIYVPGCGRAHDAAALAKLGFTVVAEDYVPEAIEEAKKLYSGISNLTLRAANIFDKEPSDFDAVFDRAVLCALSPRLHQAYVDKCSELTKVNGFFLALPFTKLSISESEGPPFAIAPEKLKKMLSEKYHIECLELSVPAPKPSSVLLEQAMLVAKKVCE